MELIVRGELAKQMLEEIQRPATKEELDVLRRAMKNRIPRRKVDDKMKKINTYDMVLAVCYNGTAVIVDHGGVEHSDFWLDNTCFCEENGFVGLPEKIGVYRCEVEHWTSVDVESGEWEFRVIVSEKAI